VWLVELAPLSEEALVLPAVAKAVKVPEQPGRPLTDALVDALREKRLLLILDNCEHLKEERVQLTDVTCRWWVWASGKNHQHAPFVERRAASHAGEGLLASTHQARTGFSVKT
jgi:predicted ATPase